MKYTWQYYTKSFNSVTTDKDTGKYKYCNNKLSSAICFV